MEKITLALNLAIIEMDHKFKFQPQHIYEWVPLWNNVHEAYYPQDNVGKLSNTYLVKSDRHRHLDT